MDNKIIKFTLFTILSLIFVIITYFFITFGFKHSITILLYPLGIISGIVSIFFIIIALLNLIFIGRD